MKTTVILFYLDLFQTDTPKTYSFLRGYVKQVYRSHTKAWLCSFLGHAKEKATLQVVLIRRNDGVVFLVKRRKKPHKGKQILLTTCFFSKPMRDLQCWRISSIFFSIINNCWFLLFLFRWSCNKIVWACITCRMQSLWECLFSVQ